MSHSLAQSLFPCRHAHEPLLKTPEEHGMEDGGSENEAPHTHTFAVHRPHQRRALLFCVLLTATMMVVEFVAGWVTGSLMLMSDAIHMLSHATALGISFLAVVLARRTPSDELPFGLYRIEILAAFLNGVGLAGFSLWIVYEGILRLLHPVAIPGPTMTAVALIGLTVNLATAVILRKSGVEDLNTKSAFFHMLADTFSSVAIVVGGVVLSLTHWTVIDPVLSLLVAGVVVKWAWGLLRDSVLVLLERMPPHLDWHILQEQLMQKFPEIKNVHDPHVWEITSQLTCLSAHLVLDDVPLSEAHRLQVRITEYLRRQFGIGHVVLQVEC